MTYSRFTSRSVSKVRERDLHNSKDHNIKSQKGSGNSLYQTLYHRNVKPGDNNYLVYLITIFIKDINTHTCIHMYIHMYVYIL